MEECSVKDPHVVSLIYQLKTDATVSFDDPPPIEDDTDSFHVRLDDGELTVSMKGHFPSVQSACDVVEPWLHSWEIYTALEHSGQRQIWFDYDDAEIIDRDPPKRGEPITTQVEAAECFCQAVSMIGYVTRKHYPQPPGHFIATQEVNALWKRFQGYRDGKEPLLSMAYFCLSFVESRLGKQESKRKNAAAALNIERNVLDKVGNLSTRHGDLSTARKIDANATGQPLTEIEERWLECAVLGLIKQFGAYSGNPPHEELTMADLPPLSP